MHVFYCDDDQDDIIFFTETVRRINSEITTTTVSDPEEALTVLEDMSAKPDFIFFDANMPKLDGLECAIAIKRNKKLRKVAFVILSSGLDSRQIAAYNKLGVHTFVAKTTMDDLEETLRGLLNQKEL